PPDAELMAGVRVVIAENIERIYNENCQNLGVLTSTDFSLIERIRNGEEIELSEFTEGVDPITRDIIEYGGLFEYNVARLQGMVTAPGGPPNGERHGGVEPDLGDPAAVPDARGDAAKDAGAAPYTAARTAARPLATSRATNEASPTGDGATNEAARAGDGTTASHNRETRTQPPMTIAEKIFASRWVVDAAENRFGVPGVQP